MTCPAHINVQGYVQLITQGKYKQAVELIYKQLPLPGVLGGFVPILVKAFVAGPKRTSRFPYAS